MKGRGRAVMWWLLPSCRPVGGTVCAGHFERPARCCQCRVELGTAPVVAGALYHPLRSSDPLFCGLRQPLFDGSAGGGGGDGYLWKFGTTPDRSNPRGMACGPWIHGCRCGGGGGVQSISARRIFEVRFFSLWSASTRSRRLRVLFLRRDRRLFSLLPFPQTDVRIK